MIVKNKRILTTGYNGAPAGIRTCVERGECMRKKQGIASGTRHELCYAIHAEQNAIIQAAKLGVSIQDATLYCTHQPCVICAKMIVNSGISRVVYREGYPDEFARQMLLEGGVKLEKYEETDAWHPRPRHVVPTMLKSPSPAAKMSSNVMLILDNRCAFFVMICYNNRWSKIRTSVPCGVLYISSQGGHGVYG